MTWQLGGRPTARRTAAVLMMALVAMLLVATGGSARAASPQRVSVGTGHASTAHVTGRHAVTNDQSAPVKGGLHLDLASTPPESAAPADDTPTYDVTSVSNALLDTDVVTPRGRAPPAL